MSIKKLEFHELANIFPLMEGKAFDDLVEDMRQHGQRELVYLYEGKILDGRNRYNACKKLGKECDTMAFPGEGTPLDFVISLNLHRRHLDSSQRAMVAAKLVTTTAGTNQHTPKGGTSQAAAAEALNVGTRTVQRATEVVEHGAPELVAAVQNGTVKVTDAANITELPKAKQKAAVKAVVNGKAKTVTAAAKPKEKPAEDDGGYELHEAAKPLEKLQLAIEKCARVEMAAAMKVVGKEKMQPVRDGLDAANQAVQTLRKHVRKSK